MGGTTSHHAPTWPVKHDLFGVGISATCYDDVIARLLDAADRREPASVDFMPVHGLMTAALDGEFRRRINSFEIVAPDGQPVRWALNRFHRTGLTDRVYGPELMPRLCEAAAARGTGVYLYGSSPRVIERLRDKLLERFPQLTISGYESPPYRPLTDREDAEVVRRINDSGAGLLFIGLGCPRQEQFAYEHRESIEAVQLCVGAAFDFMAGTKSMAPGWMQRRGMEWVYRLSREPRRLFKRYLVTNTMFTLFVVRRMVMGR